MGALGSAVFGSALWGLALWGVHCLAAGLLGAAQRSKTPSRAPARTAPAPPVSFAEAMTEALPAAVQALLSIGGYVIFFSALLGVAGRLGFPEIPAAALAERLGARLIVVE